MTYRKTISRLSLITLPLLTGLSVHAGSLTVGDIDTLQQENLVLAQQARAAELRLRIAQANKTGDALTSPVISSGNSLVGDLPAPSNNIDGVRPRLIGIQGVRGQLEARVLTNGQTHTLRKGQSWPGSNVSVAEISLDGITLSSGVRLAPGDFYAK